MNGHETLTPKEFEDLVEEVIGDDYTAMDLVDDMYHKRQLNREQFVLYMHYLTAMYVRNCWEYFE